MKDFQIQIFVQSITNYFDKITDTAAETGVPFLKEEEKNILMEYTGVIGISGKIKGAVYFTADDNFLSELLECITPGAEKSNENLADIAGELANTISGNAQEILGRGFHISVPIIFSKSDSTEQSSLKIKASTFVIPLRWKSHKAFLAVGLEKEV